MILGKKALEEVEKENLVKIINRQEFGAFSTDIRIDKLYKHTKESHKVLQNPKETPGEISSEEFIKYLEPVEWVNNKIVLSKNNYFFWQPIEEVELAPFFVGEVYTRSGWARLGVNSTDDMETRTYSEERRRIKPLCLAYSYGPEIEINKGDSIAQIVIKDDDLPFLIPEHIKQTIEKGDFVIEFDGKKLKYDKIKLEKSSNRPLLTMDNKILVYNGGILSKNTNYKEKFSEVDISKPVFLPKGTFFLSSSEQSIEVPEYCVGYVSQFIFDTPFLGHPNAPLIGPKNVFKGKVTFENMLTSDMYVVKGISQSFIHLLPLAGADSSIKKSSYYNQKRVQASKI